MGRKRIRPAFICKHCGKLYEKEQTLIHHIRNEHIFNLCREEQIKLIHGWKKFGKLSDLLNDEQILDYLLKIKEYNNCENYLVMAFRPYVKLIQRIREFDTSKDIDNFFNRYHPWKLKNPQVSQSKELAEVTFEGEEEQKSLYQTMLEKNPYYQHDGSMSPFSKDFNGYKNLSEKEKEQKIRKAIGADRDDKGPVQYKYWMKKGYTEEEAKKKVHERQVTFSREICIKKYGEEEGLKVFAARQEKWLSNYQKLNYSNISQELFWAIYEQIKDNYSEIYFATLNQETKEKETEITKNNEYCLRLENTSIKPDFFIPETNKIIEFDGEYWHRVNDGRLTDDERDNFLTSHGYKVFHIKEKEYRQNPEKNLQDCLNFLNE